MTEQQWAEQIRDAGEAHRCLMRAFKLLQDMQRRDPEAAEDWDWELERIGDIRDVFGEWLQDNAVTVEEEDEETEVEAVEA